MPIQPARVMFTPRQVIGTKASLVPKIDRTDAGGASPRRLILALRQLKPPWLITARRPSYGYAIIKGLADARWP